MRTRKVALNSSRRRKSARIALCYGLGAVAILAFLVTMPVMATEPEGAAHLDPSAGVVLSLAVVLVGAKLGGHLATTFGQPSVLGELVMGVALGNLSLFGVTALDYLKTDPSIDMLSKLGVIL